MGLGLVVDPHCVALGERTPCAVLAGQAQGMSFKQQTSEGKVFG